MNIIKDIISILEQLSPYELKLIYDAAKCLLEASGGKG